MNFEISDGQDFVINSVEDIKEVFNYIRKKNPEHFILSGENFVQAALASDNVYFVQYVTKYEVKETDSYEIPLNEVENIFTQYFNNDLSFLDHYKWNLVETRDGTLNETQSNQQTSNKEEDIFKDPVSFLKNRTKSILKNKTSRIIKNKTSKIIRKGIGGILKKIIK